MDISSARLQLIQHIAEPGSSQDGAHEILNKEQALLHRRTPDETDSKAQRRARRRSTSSSRGSSPHNKSVMHNRFTAGVTTSSTTIDNNANCSARPPGHKRVEKIKMQHR